MPSSLRLRRLIWTIVYILAFRPTPRFACEGWRRFLLRQFGAVVGKGCRIAPSCRVWAPWNLSMGAYVCLADEVDCYTQDKITLGDYATVSQRTFLCTASHDIRFRHRPLTTRPITIESHAWVCAEAFIGPGVTVGEGAVVAARAVATKDVSTWTVVGGNPARHIAERKLLGLAENVEDACAS